MRLDATTANQIAGLLNYLNEASTEYGCGISAQRDEHGVPVLVVTQDGRQVGVLAAGRPYVWQPNEHARQLAMSYAHRQYRIAETVRLALRASLDQRAQPVVLIVRYDHISESPEIVVGVLHYDKFRSHEFVFHTTH